jgi:HEAT repeat protein
VLAVLTRGLARARPLENASIDEAIAAAGEPTADRALRLAALRRLSALATDEAIDVLEGMLRDEDDSHIRNAIAEALASSPNSQARDIRNDLLESDDDEVVSGALRGLATSGDPEASETLAAFVNDLTASEAVRARAAELLADVDPAAARGLLSEALEQENQAVVSGLLDGLGRQPYAETSDIFRGLLGDPELPVELRVVAVEALERSTSDAAPLLVSQARDAAEPEIRMAAVDSLQLLEDAPGVPNALARLLQDEAAPEVRSGLYRALSLYPSEAVARDGSQALVARVMSEQTHEARLHGYRLVASVVSEQQDAALNGAFDTEMVPWLTEQAVHGSDRYTRGVALDALEMASTPGSNEALLDLTHSRVLDVVAGAEEALRLPKQAR